jgi:hypothetical protein
MLRPRLPVAIFGAALVNTSDDRTERKWNFVGPNGVTTIKVWFEAQMSCGLHRWMAVYCAIG